MNREVRAAVFERAAGMCECGCGHPLGESGHLDHFFGRRNAPETTATCWALRDVCDLRKTRNEPSAAQWLRLFMEHAEKHGYIEERTRAENRLFFVTTRASFG
jgi:hypothetical protein